MFRIGQSSDVHRFIEGDHIVLGGVKIEAPFAVDAHSDGDALVHAIAEAILGALALRDLGTHFSDTAKENENRCSLDILADVVEMMENRGYQIGNVDSLIMIEKPKMAPYNAQMKENLARVLHCDESQVNVKATRGEKVGFVGRQEGVLAQAIVLLQRRNENE